MDARARLFVLYCESGDVAGVRRAVLSGADVAAEGPLALRLSVENGHFEVVRELLAAHVDVNSLVQGSTALTRAIGVCNYHIALLLLEHDAKPEAPPGCIEVPLVLAAAHDQGHLVEVLIAKGAQVNTAGSSGRTALMWAVIHRNAEMVGVLLANGANPNIRDNLNASALWYAGDNARIVRMLRRSGAIES